MSSSSNVSEELRRSSITYSSSATDPTATINPTTNQNDNGRHTSIASVNPNSVHPAKDITSPVNPSTESNPLNAHHRPSIQGDDHQGIVGETPVNMAATSQNAPGRAGSVGENAMGALGYGGSVVGRPKEDQGLGEKVANLLGV